MPSRGATALLVGHYPHRSASKARQGGGGLGMSSTIDISNSALENVVGMYLASGFTVPASKDWKKRGSARCYRFEKCHSRLYLAFSLDSWGGKR